VGRTLREIAEILHGIHSPNVIELYRELCRFLSLPQLTIWHPLPVRVSPQELKDAMQGRYSGLDRIPSTEVIPGYRVLETSTILGPIMSMDQSISTLPWKNYYLPLPGESPLDWCFAVTSPGALKDRRFVTLFSGITTRAWTSPIRPTDYLYNADIGHPLSFY
jgi:hypothetical protein